MNINSKIDRDNNFVRLGESISPTIEKGESVLKTGTDTSLKAPTADDRNGGITSVVDAGRSGEKALREREEFQLLAENLFDASTLINLPVHANEIFRVISNSCQEFVEFDNLTIFWSSENGRGIYPAYVLGGIKDFVKGLSFSYDEGLINHCIETKEALLSVNTHGKERGKGADVGEMKSHIVVPLIIEGKCVGALHISRAAATAYDQRDVEALNPLSEIISPAVRNSALYSGVKEFVQELEKRIEERSERIEILFNTEENLQKEENFEKRLKIIIENINMLGLRRYGIFVVNPMRKRLEFHSGKGIDFPAKGTSIPLRDSGHFGVKCVSEKRTMHVKDNINSSVWVPIIVQDEAFAALTADNMESKITDEDAKDLEILAGMCGTFIDRTRIVVESVAEGSKKNPKYQLDPAEAYIVTEKKPVKAVEIFYDLVTHGIPGFIISREHPERLRRKYKFVRTPMLWLSRSERENTISSDDLFMLECIIEDFTRKSSESVILLDGLEYLITQTSFEKVLQYVQELIDIIILNNSRLLISLHKDALSPREYSLLEREVIIL